MIGVFEQAHYAAVNKIENKPATARTMESELKFLARDLKKVADHFDGMHGDTVRIWAAGADAAINGAALTLLLRTAEEWAQASVATLKRAKRIEERGRTKDFKAEWLRAAAAWVYERLTNRKANTAFDAYAGQELETPFAPFLNLHLRSLWDCRKCQVTGQKAKTYGQEKRKFSLNSWSLYLSD